MEKIFTCIECPMGCTITVENDGGENIITGNNCPRGMAYVQNELKCPMRVLTSTVRHSSGKMLPVKTDKPIKKANMFKVMEKLKEITVKGEIKIGDIIAKNISDDANLVATDNI